MSYLVLNAFVFFFTIESLRPPIFYIIMLVLALMGFINGLVTMRTLKFFGLTDWIFSAAVASITLPAFIYLVFGIELILKSISGGYTKNNLLYQFVLTVVWCVTNALTAFFGAYKGYLLKRVEA